MEYTLFPPSTFTTEPQFSFPLVKGDVNTALKDPYAIILTEALATALFGTTDPIGKTIKIDNRYDLQVTAVVKDVPSNSTLRFDFLAPYEFNLQQDDFLKANRSNWGINNLMNVVELKEGITMESFSKKISALLLARDPDNKDQALVLHPLKRWHLYEDFQNWVNVGGKIEYVRLFGVVGLFVLLLACINFMNLATARSQKRAKEVGIRKAIGSQRRQLVMQFLSESLLTTLLAFGVAIGLMALALPYLRDVGFEHVTFDFGSASLVLVGLVACLLTGLLAGSYPAWYLSSFLPVQVLKGVFKQGRGTVTFRQVLVVGQFAVCIALIVSTVIVFQQVNYARARSIGYNPDNLLSVEGSRDLAVNYPALKRDLLNSGYLEAVTKTSSPITAVYNIWSDFSWQGKDPSSQMALEALMTEWDYEKTVGLKFKQGRAFSREYASDSNAVILNEAALKVIGYRDPIGQTMTSSGRVITIVGVVEDVLMRDPYKPIAPGVILFNANMMNTILLRVKSGVDVSKALTALQPVFEKHNPSQPFEYRFVDEEFDRKFALEKQVGKLAGLFAALTIFISCLGLFGLVMFLAERRTKEIGIRKVLGASVTDVWVLLSKEFVWLVVVACAIASPLAFWFMQGWLERYDYRIRIHWWIFACAGLTALLIALATVSFQAIKAALANPVKSLRTE